MGYEKCVHPGTAFVGFVAVGVEVAGCEVVEGRAEGGILVAECSIEVAGLEESSEAGVDD